jgi:hypothetical protein
MLTIFQLLETCVCVLGVHWRTGKWINNEVWCHSRN